jgi:hypothetical protein
MRSTIVAVLSLFMATAVLAWDLKNDPQLPDDGGKPLVYFVHSYYQETPNVAGLDDRISVHVQNFGKLLDQVHGNCQGIVLFIDGMPIKADKAESCDKEKGHVRYRLLRDKENKDDETAWHSLLGRPSDFVKAVSVSVGADQEFSIPTIASDFDLEVIPKKRFMFFVGIIALALGISSISAAPRASSAAEAIRYRMSGRIRCRFSRCRSGSSSSSPRTSSCG